MSLEIEFDYDDTQGGVWSPAPEAPPLRERVGRRWNPGLVAGNPLFVHLGIALAALALGAASTAGFLEGGNAARNRTVTRMHLAPVNAFVVDALRVPAADSAAGLLAEPWTNAFDQHVSLSVINDGPDPVTVLGAQVTAPQFGTVTLEPVGSDHAATAGTGTTTPGTGTASAPSSAKSASAAHIAADSALTPPGGVATLRGMAHIVCGDFASVDPAATVARLTVRTADDKTRVQTLMVDRFSDIQEQAVCRAMPGPQVVTSASSVPDKAPGKYTFVIDVTNRAPFPLLATMPSNVVQSWQGIAGLDVQAPAPTTIPPHGSAVITVPIAIASCGLALQAAQSAYAVDALAFTDARDGPNNPLSRESDQSLALYDFGVITRYCGTLELPGISGGGVGSGN